MDENNMTTMRPPYQQGQIESNVVNSIPNLNHNAEDDNNINKTRPFICQVCTRAFIRQEHLKRHMRSHTNEKPFLCIFCGRCFARRDLVLRHQQKLHDTLIGTSQHHELLSQFHNDENILDKIEATKHVIKIEGNKHPILPTPTNPMAKSQSQLKKAAKLAEREARKVDKLSRKQAKLNNSNNNSKNDSKNKIRMGSQISNVSETITTTVQSPVTNQSSSNTVSLESSVVPNTPSQHSQLQKKQRHASFSAASAFTYRQQNERPTENQLQNDLELMSGIPHQVGFSTPQMSATDLVDRAHENGIENIPFLTLDSKDNKSVTNFKDFLFHNDKYPNQANPGESLIDTPQSPRSKQPTKHSHDENLAAFNSVPFLADFLTMSSSVGGVGGFLNSQTSNHINGTDNNNSNNVQDMNFEANAVTNLDWFQYDDNLLNLSELNTNSSATSSVSSRENSCRTSTNVTPVLAAPNGNNQQDDSYLNRNHHGLYYNAHNSHNLDSANDIHPPPHHHQAHHNHAVANETNGQQQHPNNGHNGQDKVFSKFITHAPFETEFMHNVDVHHINDIGFVNVHDQMYYQNPQTNHQVGNTGGHSSRTPNSGSRQSSYSQNNYHSPVGNNNIQEATQIHHSRSASHTSHSAHTLNYSHHNNGFTHQDGHHVMRSAPNTTYITPNHFDSRNNSIMNQAGIQPGYRSNVVTPENEMPGSHVGAFIDQTKSKRGSHSGLSLSDTSEDTHLTINFSPSYPRNQQPQKLTPTQSESHTPTLPPPSQIPSRSQSRHASIPVCHHSKSPRLKPMRNDESTLINLFQSRQVDIHNKHLEISSFAKVLSTDNLSAAFHENMAHTEKLAEDFNFNHDKCRVILFTDQYREDIIHINHLKPDQLPTTEELNKYVGLYQDEFHRFFPFVHLQSIIPTIDNHPFLLSIAMIGALYSFHSIHSVLLSNIAWFQIKELLERQHRDYSITPLWAIQSIVLLTFIGIFSNDINVTKSMKIQLVTLVELVKLTKLNEPLEHLVSPPIESDHSLQYMNDPRALQQLKDRYHSRVQFEKDFQYFIRAQTRIRTCHTILIISNFFTSLTGIQSIFHSIDLKCGLPCYKEILYQSPNSQIWSRNLAKFNIELDSKFSLIELSNGNGTYDNCLMYLSSGAEFYSLNSKTSFKTLLSLLFSIHEKISIERIACFGTPGHKHHHHINKKDGLLRWKIDSIPVISSMLKHWEMLFLKNGGIFKPNHDNIETINAFPSLRLIVPLYHFVKVRENVQICPLMKKIWKHDWNGMNHQMSKFYFDWETLRGASEHALHILEFWIDVVSILEFDPKRITITTPVFSLSYMVSSVLILSEYLRVMESTLQNISNGNHKNNVIANQLQISDKVLWIKIFHLLERIESHLKQKGVVLSGPRRLSVAVIDNLSMGEIRDLIRVADLSKAILNVGVDMLRACPVWSVGILFAQALQSRSMALQQMPV